MDASIIILTLVFLAMFVIPFAAISIMHKVKDHKQSSGQEDSSATNIVKEE